MTLEKYFHIVHNLLERHWAVADKQVAYKTYSKDSGAIDGKILFPDGSFIDFYEEIFIVNRTLMHGKYHYQYVKESEVFRYDNHHRHPGISPPFHHKHTSAGVIQIASVPKLIDIVEEAVRYLF